MPTVQSQFVKILVLGEIKRFVARSLRVFDSLHAHLWSEVRRNPSSDEKACFDDSTNICAIQFTHVAQRLNFNLSREIIFRETQFRGIHYQASIHQTILRNVLTSKIPRRMLNFTQQWKLINSGWWILLPLFLGLNIFISSNLVGWFFIADRKLIDFHCQWLRIEELSDEWNYWCTAIQRQTSALLPFFSSLDASIQTQIRCQLKCSLTASTAENDLSISTLLDESISQQICRFADGSTNT